jgi:uroporphyrinogen-III decarboxylase
MNERQRIINTLKGEPTDKLPWATRLDIWHTSRLRTNTLPVEMSGKELNEIYRDLKIGRQCYSQLIYTRLRGVDMTVEFNGEVVRKESDPVLRFPRPSELVTLEKPGDTLITLKTPAGQSRMRFQMVEELIRGAAAPYIVEHLLKDDNDFAVVKWIINHSEIVADYDGFKAKEDLAGDLGFTIGMMERVPFQRILLDFMGEEQTIYSMMDSPDDFQYLLDILTEQGREMVELALASSALMLEFTDNVEGSITSPTLFQNYCMPFMQECADRIHAQGRYLGSHMDGNMEPLLHLIPECGVDVVESFSPAPLTRLTFEDAWKAWRGKVLMWGAIPSPIFESHVPEHEFTEWIKRMLDLLGDDRRIILGIGDQAVSPSLIERIKKASEMLGR